MDRFTAFPDIYPADGPPGTEVSWQIGAAPISLQDAVLSWALLLSSVTGEEFPVFALNQTPVKVDLSENRFAAVDIDEAVHESRDHGYTAIVTDDSQRTYSQSEQKLIKRTYNLCLNLDLATGSGYLQSEIGIHVEGLVQIGGQLKQFMQRLDQSRDFPVGISSTDVPLLSIANPNPQILPGPQLLHQLAFNHGRRLATALDFLGPDQTVQSLSYEDLDNLSTTLAGHVAKALGSLHSESTPRIVPVLLPQSVDLYIAWLAILKAGAAFCPLGTDSPEDRINFILKDVAAEVIITQTKLSAKLPKEKAISVILVDKLQNEIDATKEHVEEPPPTELAYVMYTSGSTGRPKGVGISHLAVTQSLLAHDRLIPSFRRFLQFASPTFDVSVFEVFFPWFRGTTLVGSERTTMLHDLPSVINRLQVDAAELTPTVAGELLLSRPAAPSLNVLLTIGEMLTKRVVDEFAWSSVKEGILHGMYGPTEAAIHCTVAPKFETGSRVNLIGRPLQTVSAFVISLKDDVNSHNPEFLPIGHIGELVVGGPQLTTGYINRPSENSKAFLQSREHGRLYRTGDKARFLPNGDIECLGRISTGQVKLRGQRVELGEIENVICMAQNVRSAIAIVVDRILVVWVLADNDDVVAPQLRRFCQQRLPSYMIPGDFVIIHEVPRLPSGKVDKKALESEYIRQNRSGSQDTTRTFRDELEEKISIVVIETLRTPVGSSESLATAGLDSLTGIQLASGLRRRGVNIDVGKLLAADTIEGIWRLAKRCEGAKSKEEVDTKVASLWNTISEAGWTVLRSIGVHSEIENVEPCSHIQAAMLAESFRDPRSYCNWVELHFDDGIALMSIKEAICKVAECNDILRSGFLNIDVPGNTFCRFTWKSLRLENFQETDLFDRAWAVTGASGILVPFRVQLRRVKKSVQALVHLHHALYDGWSWELFLSDLQSSLDAAPLKRRPPYSNVVRHLMEFSLSESIADSTSYWEDAMRDVVPSTWPSFHDKTDTPQGTGTADRALGIPLVEIDNVAKRLSISRQTFFQAAFAYLLSSYLDTSDVLFGTVFSGRTSPVQGIEDIIGPCLRVLPTRLNLAWVRTITDLLLATHKSNRKSLEYGDLSLREIKKVSEIRANGPLFDSLIVWQETPWTDLTNTECQFKEHAAAEFLEFSMTIQLEPRGDAVSVRAVYDRSIFPAAQVNMFLEQIESVTSLFVRSPDLSLTAVNGHLSTSVLSVDNTEYEHQEDMKSLAYGVELLAVDDPQRNAIEFLNAIDPETGETDVDTITYYQFNSQANRLARHLASLGVVSGDLVAIILDKSINLYISILAVIKLGAGYVPLTPQTPSERIEFALAQSKPRLCILTSKLRPNLPSLDSLHFLEFEKIDIERYPDSNISSVHNVGNIAYIVFTSGSTGRPKGVQITHHNLQSNISVLTSIYPVGNDAKILQACSQAFDVSVFEIFFAWHTGMTLCSSSNDVMFRDIELVIRSRNVTHLSLTPTVASLVHPRNVPGVRFLVTAGEGLTAKVHNDWSGQGLYQGYGPSETTNICTVRPNLTLSDPLRNIGKPFKNTSVFVISDSAEFSLIPRGGVGELCFGGDQVGRGYLSLPDLTKEKFINHPQYGRLYRSGDFGRLLLDGSIIFTGRRDDQVKLRGQRVELGEINSALLRNNHVRDCTTMILGNKNHGQQQLTTFWIPASGRENDKRRLHLTSVVQTLFGELSLTLPDYMVPSSLIPVEKIPMTAVRKIDERKLKAFFAELNADDLQPFSRLHVTSEQRGLSEAENAVARVISEATQTPLQNLQPSTSIYSLGIDSLSAIPLSRQLRQAGFGQIDVSVILRHGSISELAKVITKFEQKRQQTGDSKEEKPFDEEYVHQIHLQFSKAGHNVHSVIPCTPLQEAMLSRTVSKNKNAYCNHLLFEVSGDLWLLRTTWEQMVRKHEILRTCFAATANGRFAYAQVILQSMNVPWTCVKTNANDMDTEICRQKSRFIMNMAQDVYVAPYSIVAFQDSQNDRNMLLFSIHHALHDGEAMSQLLKEVERCYGGHDQSQVPQFRHFVEYMLCSNKEESEQFWHQYLRGISPQLLCSALKLTSDAGASRYQQHKIDLEIDLQDFEKMCKNLSVTALNIFHAAWSRMLSAYTLSSDVCFGNVFSGRTIPLDGVESIIGPCFNTLPIRLQIPSTALNMDVVKLAHQANVDIMPHQLSSLRQIQKRATHDGLSLFDTLFLLQSPFRGLDGTLWKLVEEEGDMDFPLVVEIIPSLDRNRIRICLHSDSLCVPSSDARMVAENFMNLVCHTLKYPAAQAMDSSIFTGDLPSFVTAARITKSSGSHAHDFSSPTDSAMHTLSKDEVHVQDMLSRLSGRKSAGIKRDTSIFQLGLDSINAVQLSNLFQNAGNDVSAADILETPTMGEIALLLKSSSSKSSMETFDFGSFESKHKPSICDQFGLTDQEIESIRPCTPVQSGMLAIFTNTNGDAYYNRTILRSGTPLDLARLKYAWSETMARHEMLRTGFVHLRDQTFPFAMITFQKNAAGLPWTEVETGASEPELIRQRHDPFKNLHRPAWSLLIRNLETTTEIELGLIHAIYDAQSLNFILSDVVRYYQGLELSPVVQNKDILSHILMHAISPRSDAEEFWTKLAPEYQSVKFPNLSPIIVDNPQLLVTSRFSSRSLAVIDDQCQRLGVSLQAIGQASWAQLLSGYTGEINVSFGIVLSGRDVSQDAQKAAFPCLVTVPFPCWIQGTNRDFVTAIMNQNVQLVKRQFTPLSKVQKWLNRDQALFDTLFVYQKISSEGEDTRFWDIVEEDARIDYPISIEMIPSHGQLELRLTHRSDILPQQQAQLILEQLDSLLVNCLSFPESESTQFRLQTSLLSITPAKEQLLPAPVNLLHEFVETGALNNSDKTAFEFAVDITVDGVVTQTWTYHELNQVGNKVARLLRNLGTSLGELVAICFDKCPPACFAILGVLKAGCAFVALDPSAPTARKQFILDDSASGIVLCASDKYEELCLLSGVTVVALDKPGLLDDISPLSPVLERTITPHDTCYCLYTSGTTGTPKGCEITHGNAVQAMQSFTRLFDGHWDEESRWLQFASFHFDVSVLEQYWSWSVGICVTSCPRDLLFQDLPGTIQKLRITHIDLTPSLARLITPDEVPSLCKGVFITGGEQLKQEILDVWGDHEVIYNGYGPTEVTIGCTMLPRMTSKSKPSNIGPQFDNVGSYVFKPGTITPVLRGGVGELCVSGALVGRGYRNRPELTEERFQFLEESQQRIYRTGDLVRIFHDGSFQFLGRIDDQVKLRGQRLEIGEINAVIQSATADLEEAATLVIKHPGQGREQLVSFVTRRKSEKSQTPVAVLFNEETGKFLSMIKESCQAKLPTYMVPTHIIPISALPLSPNNKVDGKALNALYERIRPEELQKLDSLAVETEFLDGEDVQKITEILANFTRTSFQEISPSTSIYELGLDSISVIALAQTLRSNGFPAARVSLIMKYPKVAAISRSLRKLQDVPTSTVQHFDSKQRMEAFMHKNLPTIAEQLGVSITKIEGVAPCTPIQEGMIFRFLESKKSVYCSSFDFELRSDTDLGRLRWAWSQTQQAVQLLRARLISLPDGYAQVIFKDDNLPWFESTISEDEDVSCYKRHHFESWYDSIDELTGFLWNVVVIRSPSKLLMCLNIFHALYDGNSLPLLLEQVALRYLQREVPPTGPTFLEILPHGPLRKQPEAEEFWVDHLSGCRGQKLFTQAVVGDSGVTYLQEDISEVLGLQALKTSLQVTEHSIFHACWLLTLHFHFSILPPLGVVVSGRALDVTGGESVIGPLFNTIPSFIPAYSLNTVAELVQACHQYYVSALPFQHTPLREIMKWMRRTPDRPLFEILYVFQKDDDSHGSTSEKVWTVVDSAAEVDYPLSLEVRQSSGGTLRVTLAAKSNAVSAEMAKAVVSTFREILTELLCDPTRRLPSIEENLHANESELHLVNDDQKTDMLRDNHHRELDWTTEMHSIRGVIADLAGLDNAKIDATTSIFELGLDSIDAIKLSSRLRKLGLDLPVSTIMSCRTILAMSRNMSRSLEERPKPGVTLDQYEKHLTASLKEHQMLPRDAVKVLPTTALQEAMIAQMIASEYQHYYSEDILELETDVDLQKLLSSWKTVINANPILRTSFAEIEDAKIPFTYAQIVHVPDDADFAVVDVQEQSLDAFLDNRKTRKVVHDPRDPVFSLYAVRSGHRRFIVLSAAHALYDGWSLDLLHTDVAKSYFAEPIQRPSYEDVLGQIIAASQEKGREYWRAALGNFTPRSFPRGNTVAGRESEVHRGEKVLDVASEDIDRFCRGHGVTVQALTVATWALVLAGYLKSLDVVFGLVLSGRNFAGADEIMFPTMNTVAFRAILHGTRLEMLRYIQNTLGDIFEHQHYPLRKAGIETGARALFDTLFIYQKRPSGPTPLQDQLYHSVGGSADTDYPLSVEMEQMGGSMVCRLAARDDLLGFNDMCGILERINTVLRQIITQPDIATIELTNDGMVICESVPFQEDDIKEIDRADDDSDDRTSWTEMETKIRQVLSSVAGLPEEQIRKESTLFNLGLDSISAIKVSSLLKRQSVNLPVSAMLKASTVHRMAMATKYGSQKMHEEETNSLIENLISVVDVRTTLTSNGIITQQVEKVLPSTSGQIYFLAVHMQNPRLFYPEFFYFAKFIGKAHLDTAWMRLTSQLPIMRTVFLPTGHEELPFLQVILKQVDNGVVWHKSLDGSSINARSFQTGPVALHAAETKNGIMICLNIHHALYDAVSLPRLLDTLAQLCTGQEFKFPKSDLSALIAIQCQSSSLKMRKQYWENYLSGTIHNPLQDRLLGKRGEIQRSYRPGLVVNIARVEIIARYHGLSIQSLFLAIYAKVHSQVLTRHTTDDPAAKSASDFVFGVYLANRAHTLDGLPELIAPTLNLVPLRIRATSISSIVQSAHQIQTDLHEISRVEHSGVSLIEISNWTGVHLDVFVNFLRLPELDEREASSDIHFAAVDPRTATAQSHEGQRAEINGQPQFSNGIEFLADIYRSSIDVEAAIRNGCLDVGIFAPEARLNLATMEGVLDEIRQEMERLVEETHLSE